MRAVQITLDDELVKTIDQMADRLDRSRSTFTRDALRAALAKINQVETALLFALGF